MLSFRFRGFAGAGARCTCHGTQIVDSPSCLAHEESLFPFLVAFNVIIMTLYIFG